jgi:hypothetical protein
MLNHYDLGLYVGWFEIPRDFIGLPELYGFKCENLITWVIVFCTCALIIWMVPLQLASEQDSTLNLSNVYLKQRFCFIKSVLSTYSYIYRFVKSEF